MIQPKFKFGDKVFSKECVPFVIDKIRKDSECNYVYGSKNEGDLLFAEFDLELYQEPKKKKLYAWKDPSGVVRLTIDTKLLILGSVNNWERIEEYDIEYK